MKKRGNEMITYLEPDYEAVSKRFIDHWRVFNGENWVHGFKEKSKAIQFAKKNGGTRIAFFKKIKGKDAFVNVERVG